VIRQTSTNQTNLTNKDHKEMSLNISAKATIAAKNKPKSAAFRFRNIKFPGKVHPAKFLERQIIWFANGFHDNKLPERLEAAVEKAKLQQPNWERYAAKGEERPSEWDMNEGDALSDTITQVLNAPLRDGVTIEWLGQEQRISETKKQDRTVGISDGHLKTTNMTKNATAIDRQVGRAVPTLGIY
jgi:hypothetical protein